MFWLTKLLNGPVCTPRQLQGHVDPPPLVFHSLVRLQGNPRAGRLWDDGHQLERKEVWIIGGDLSEQCSLRCKFILVDLYAGHMSIWIVVSDLLSTHEAIFLLDVDVVDGKTLLGPWLVTDAAIRTPHHTTLTTSHLQKKCSTHCQLIHVLKVILLKMTWMLILVLICV